MAKSDQNTELMSETLKGFWGMDVAVMSSELLPSDTWLIHFTNHGEAIAREGFTRGSPMTGALIHASGADAAEAGFNFAMLANDEYSMMQLAGFDFGVGVREAVMFQGTGVHVRHYDGFEQAVFWGPSAASPFVRLKAIFEDEEDLDGVEPHDMRWAVLDAAGAVVSEHESLFEAMTAVEADHAPAAAPAA